nr:MAG TPA: Translation initiation factor IF-2, N-terminal region [Caudoviricetes sp.]
MTITTYFWDTWRLISLLFFIFTVYKLAEALGVKVEDLLEK